MSIIFSAIKHLVKHGNAGSMQTKWSDKLGSFYNLNAVNIDGKSEDFTRFAGQVTLVVNVACKWGKTKSSYQAMTAMYDKLNGKGFNIMAFPCNQFGGQEPWPEAQIKKWVEDNFKVKFPLYSKVDVNGDKTHPVYTFLKTCFPGDITWNFAAKFLVDQNGIPIARFEKEDWPAIEKVVLEALEHAAKEKSEAKDDSGKADGASK